MEAVGTIVINRAPPVEMRVKLDQDGLQFHFGGREILHVKPFNVWVLRHPAQRDGGGVDVFVLDGPNLGMYCDTADIREGPYINHFISHLQFSISYPSPDRALVNIAGRTDLSKSNVDAYWYAGASKGEWEFEVQFLHSC